MAKTRATVAAKPEKKLNTKQKQAVSRVSAHLTIGIVPNCDDLFAAAEAIQALIAENCPIASSK